MRFTFETGQQRSAPAAPEVRADPLENPSISLLDPRAWASVFGEYRSKAGIAVTPDVAMGIPAFWCGVNFLAGCVASLPIKLHRKSVNGKETIEKGNLAKLIAGVVNDNMLTSFAWRREMMVSTFLSGRGMSFVEKAGGGTGDAMAFWPIETSKTILRRKQGRISYNYRDNAKAAVDVYQPSEVIDIKMLSRLDGLGVFNPIDTLRDSLGLSTALRNYSSRFFENGGVPPLALEGPAASPQAIGRAKADADEAVKQATKSNSNIVYLPSGHKLTPVGFNPEKSQLLEAQRFAVEECSRILNLPPAFLHSLINATYSNVEQQDLNFVKHCLVLWIEQWESELNVKIFGDAKGRYIEFDLNGLLRGDLLSRMRAYAQGIQSAVLKPNEARRRENLPDDPDGDRLLVNTAIQPIGAVPDPNAPLPLAGDPGTTGDPDGEEVVPGDPQTDPEDDQ